MTDQEQDMDAGGVIFYNQEVPAGVRKRLEIDLDEVIRYDETRTIHQRSATVPELVQVLLEASAWKQALGAAAVLFMKEYIKELGRLSAKSTWRQGKALASTLKDLSVEPLKKTADALARAKQSLSNRSRVSIGLPIPDDYFGTLLEIEAEEEDEIALILALFVTRVEEIEGRLEEEREQERALGAISLHVDDRGNFVAEWKDQNFEEHRVVFSSPVADQIEQNSS